MKLHSLTKLAVATIVIVVLVLVSMYRVPTTFNIAASTQTVQIVIGETHRSQWYLREASIYRQHDGVGKPFMGSILALPGVPVFVERIGSGALRLRCEVADPNQPVAKIYTSADAVPEVIRGRLVVVIPSPGTGDVTGQAMVLPVSGQIILGAEIGDFDNDPPALLLGGAVTMLAHTLIGNRRYDAGKVSLDLADYIKLDQAGDAYGLLVVGRGPDISAVFRVIAKSVSVYRFGTVGYDVYASPLTRVKNDYAMQAIWAAALFLLGLLAKLGKKDSTSGAP